MGDEYQLRRDVDRLIDDIYGVNSKVVFFATDSPLRSVYLDTDDKGNPLNMGTLDVILEYVGVLKTQEDTMEALREEIHSLKDRITALEDNEGIPRIPNEPGNGEIT